MVVGLKCMITTGSCGNVSTGQIHFAMTMLFIGGICLGVIYVVVIASALIATTSLCLVFICMIL